MDRLIQHPVIALRDHPAHAARLRVHVHRGRLISPLPGLVARPDLSDTWETRMRCAHLWAPTMTFVGAAAAKHLWWDTLPVDVIELWGAKRKQPAPWLRTSQAKVPGEFVVFDGDVAFAAPALAAVQLAKTLGGKPIDEALRRRAATLGQMRAALDAIPNQPGNARVRRLLQQSRHEPWSELERQAHLLLDRARVRGWRTNHRVHVQGRNHYVDIAFPEHMLAVELDGYEFHSDREAFERDRIKHNLLVLHGWQVLRYTWATLGDIVQQIRTLTGTSMAA